MTPSVSTSALRRMVRQLDFVLVRPAEGFLPVKHRPITYFPA